MSGAITVPPVRKPLDILPLICSFHCQVILSHLCNTMLWTLGGAVLSVSCYLLRQLALNNSNERTYNLKENKRSIKVLLMRWWRVSLKQGCVYFFSVEKLISKVKVGLHNNEEKLDLFSCCLFSNPGCLCVNTVRVTNRVRMLMMVMEIPKCEPCGSVCWCQYSLADPETEIHSFIIKLTTIYVAAVCLSLWS